jgi:hypothetical protein
MIIKTTNIIDGLTSVPSAVTPEGGEEHADSPIVWNV